MAEIEIDKKGVLDFLRWVGMVVAENVYGKNMASLEIGNHGKEKKKK